ncbi:unnamed protein product, partial [Iphiclides podalirius]
MVVSTIKKHPVARKKWSTFAPMAYREKGAAQEELHSLRGKLDDHKGKRVAGQGARDGIFCGGASPGDRAPGSVTRLSQATVIAGQQKAHWRLPGHRPKVRCDACDNAGHATASRHKVHLIPNAKRSARTPI